VSGEAAFINSLRALAGDPAARGLADDAAVLEFGGRTLVLTHDMIVEGVHFLANDAPEDIAWKLVAVNLSDLAAKGAKPLGVLLGYSLAPGSDWNEAFVDGLRDVLQTYDTPLLGGDTVSAVPGAPRSFGLTALGEAPAGAPSRSSAKTGDLLWVSGSIGDAGAGLRIAIGELAGATTLLSRYRRPEPRLALGQKLAPLVNAMMDVSDGLLIDAARMARAAGVSASVELSHVPLSEALVSALGGDRQARIDASIAGDDYELLFAVSEERSEDIRAISASVSVPLACIGKFGSGEGLTVTENGVELPLPRRLGYEHESASN
jgi:thiamine-monophosphate kinase